MEDFLDQLKKARFTKDGCSILKEEFLKRGYQKNAKDAEKFEKEIEKEHPCINNSIENWDNTGRSIYDIIMDEFRIPGV